MYLSSLIIAFIVLTLLMSFVYFYMFAKSQEWFVRYWGFSWVAYSFSLLFLILFISVQTLPLLEFRKIFDMMNILFLLYGAYAFMHTSIPSYWTRFGLYLTIWLFLGIYYNFDLLAVYLPISLYQITVTIVLCYIIYRYWEVPSFEKGLSITAFILWGFGKALLSIFELQYYDQSSLYLMEIIFSNILNFCIFVIYLQKTKNEVNIAERLYRIIAENASDVIFYYKLRPHPSFTYITPSIETMTGYMPEEFYQNPRFYLNLVHSSYFDEISTIFNGIPNIDKSMTFQMIHKNGSQFWGEFNSSVLYENHEAVAVEGILRDITKMKLAEIELLSSKQSRDLLLSYISHELKTPITSILGYVNALNDGTLSSPDEKESAMDIISKKAITLEHLINDLFQLSKLETNQFSFNFMHMSALELSQILINQHLLDIKTAGLKPAIELDRAMLSPLNVIVDPKRIDQVFSNIVFNAIKYTTEKDKLTIKFYTDQNSRNYMISISDTGAGIPHEDLPFIFDRFFKSHIPTTSGREVGSGLGLTISKEIIVGHGGEIWAKSNLGKGSTFTFQIPIYKD